MAPVCSNCNGADFVWANELKTGMTGASLSLRARGEVPIGTRICRTCGHADLFLRDISILHQPHNWRPGEFVPIVPKPAAPKPAHTPAPPPPPPPAPPSPPTSAPRPAEPDPLSAAPVEEVPVAEVSAPAEPSSGDPISSSADSAPNPDEAAAKPKAPRRRAAKPKV